MLEKISLGSVESFKKQWIYYVHHEAGLLTEEKLSEMFDSRFNRMHVHIVNSHRNTKEKKDLIEFIDEVYSELLILVEEGQLFSSDPNNVSPAVRIEAALKERRGVVKKKANSELAEGDPVVGGRLNTIQELVKLAMNIFYGVQNNKYSKFFNRTTGGAITCRGRNLITLSGIASEALIGRYRFRNVGALKHMIMQLKKENLSSESLNFLNNISVTREQVLLHLTLGTRNKKFIELVRAMLNDEDDMTIKRLFFKNSLENFVETKYFSDIQQTFIKIMNENFIEKYPLVNTLDEKGRKIPMASAIFSDCYTYPKQCKPVFDKIDTIMDELVFGFYWYDYDYSEDSSRYTASQLETFDAMDRYVIAVVDTDSNMILVDDILKHITPSLEEGMVYGDNSKKAEYDEITGISIATYMIARYVGATWDRYKWYTQMPEQNHFHVEMKNEFYFSDLFITSSKKNYIARMIVKEGMVFDKPKFEFKGVSIKKSGNNETIRDAAGDIVEMLFEPDMNIMDIMDKIMREHVVLEEIVNTDNGLQYYNSLKLADDLENMDDSEHRVKAIRFHNSLFPDNKIIPPTLFYVIPLQVDMDDLKTEYPHYYESMKAAIALEFIEKNFTLPCNRLFVTIPEMLQELDFELSEDILKNKFGKYNREIVSTIQKFEFRVEEIMKEYVQGEMLDVMFKELYEDIHAERMYYEQLAMDVYMKFRYPGSFYKVSSDMWKDSNFKLLIRLPKQEVHVTYDEEDIRVVLKEERGEALNKDESSRFRSLKKGNTHVLIRRLNSEGIVHSRPKVRYKGIFNKTSVNPDNLFKKIALPLDATIVPEFIKRYVDINSFTRTFDSLLAPIIQETGVIFVRTSDDSRVVTNIKDYF